MTLGSLVEFVILVTDSVLLDGLELRADELLWSLKVIKNIKRLIILIGNQKISHTNSKEAERYFQFALKIQYYYYLDLTKLQNTPLVYFLLGYSTFQICNIELLSKSTSLKVF